jgi:protein phosphatase
MKPTDALRRTNDQWRVAAAGRQRRYHAAAATDVGCVRTVNEDAVALHVKHDADDLQGLAVVCDGMGGHEAGEVASALAVDTIVETVRQAVSERQQTWPATLVDALQAANTRIRAASRAQRAQQGMGSTCCAVALVDGAVWCAHVGDTRCYLLRDNDLLVMTQDHSAVMHMVRQGLLSTDDARHHPDRNVISRALGSHDAVSVAAWTHPVALRDGDRLLLCTDGLYDLIAHDVLREVLAAPQSTSERAAQLVALAREAGGHDNISVVIIDVLDDAGDTTTTSGAPES